ncbi:YebC/PmpR family DNA-binding regulatory protein [Desulfohalotomaculum tongense]|uniref:YebC/PmpR family DNA-binding transcriptional regulator n=1 Tax=Desulforadius tongensis TaxID=1216062 RepID=UPI001959C2CF|nr:YebC/PmpR family DNA-binding transcriptional regulator [Desulforadius tongensis]MBM7855112.1 YebC/PmpR family DNA-binding regulatory protein [Desulforadius tongensis]
MAGHSKWANIKRKKAKVDAQRGKIFTRLTKEIILAAKLGGGDPAGNMRLKAALEKAKEANLPKDKIERAILKGTGQLSASNLEQIVYEGYGPGGVAVLMNITTDNRNRTAGEIRHIFSKHNGNLGESGCVSWMFDRKGLLVVEKENAGIEEDDLMMMVLEAGAEDMKVEDDVYEIYTAADDFTEVYKNLEAKNIPVAEAEITMIPQTTVKLQGEEAEKMMKLLEVLEEHDDVDDVYSNFEMEK